VGVKHVVGESASDYPIAANRDIPGFEAGRYREPKQTSPGFETAAAGKRDRVYQDVRHELAGNPLNLLPFFRPNFELCSETLNRKQPGMVGLSREMNRGRNKKHRTGFDANEDERRTR
jgi:hypothetical protein